MEELALKDLWQSYDHKLNKLLEINSQYLREIQTQKVRSTLRPVSTIKIIAVVFGILWVAGLGFLVIHSLTISKIFFVISLLFNMIVSTIAIIIYVKHLVLISQINNSSDVVQTQSKLMKIKLSTVQVVRILLLQLPMYTTWYINEKMLSELSTGMWIFQIGMTTLFTFAAIWFYRNISYKNLHKKWMRILFSGKEWTGLVQAENILEQIKNLE